jgi:hypothetical protein
MIILPESRLNPTIILPESWPGPAIALPKRRLKPFRNSRGCFSAHYQNPKNFHYTPF